MSSTDALFTRFEELFREYLQRPLIVGFALPVSLRLEPTKGDLLRQFFFHSWDKKELPSKELLMEVVRFLGPPPIHRFEEVEDRVAESFALALEKLEIEEPKQDEEEAVSLPQHPQQKPKPGKPADPKIRKRVEIVRKHVHKRSDFFEVEKKQALLREFEENEVPLPRNKDGFLKYPGMNWQDIASQPAKWRNVVDVLNRDRFSKKRKITTE